MKGTVRILKRFIGATMLISAFLVVLNFLLLAILVFKGMNDEQSPSAVVVNVGESLHHSSNTYSLDSSAIKLLEQNRAWAMLIDVTGHVEWNYKLPDELPEKYSLTDIAKFTKNHLMDYPVFVWEDSPRLGSCRLSKTGLGEDATAHPSNKLGLFIAIKYSLFDFNKYWAGIIFVNFQLAIG